MARALQIPEILCTVFEHVASARFHGKRTLARCALVNSLFSQRALDILWRELDYIDVLLRVLPSIQKVAVADEYEDSEMWCLVGQVFPGHLDRFRTYAERVRILRQDGSYAKNPKVDPSTYLLLSGALGGQPLLPRLHTLIWMQPELLSIEVLSFVSPSLRVFEFEYRTSGSARLASSGKPIPFFESLFAQVTANAPHLQQLSIQSVWAPCSFASFASCRDLRKVCIETPSIEGLDRSITFSKLASLEHLTELEIGPVPSFADSTMTIQGFNTLESLTLSGDCASMGHVLAMIAAPASPPPCMRVLSLVIISCTPAEARELMDVVRTRFHTSLETIKVGVRLRPQNATVTPLDVFSPLLHAAHIRDADLKIAVNPKDYARVANWPDGDIYTLASAWRSLVSLKLTWHNVIRGPSLACHPARAGVPRPATAAPL